MAKYKVSWDEVVTPEHVTLQKKKQQTIPAVTQKREFTVDYWMLGSDDNPTVTSRGFTGVKVTRISDLEIEL